MSEPRMLPLDLTGYDLYRNGFPHEVFTQLREESPVWLHPTAATRRSPGGIDFWVVLGHPELQMVSRDWQAYSSLEGPSLTKTAPERQGHTIIASDPPGHTRMRKLVNAGFTPRMIARLDELVVRRTTEVLDAAAALGTCNFVRDVAYQLPMHLISDIMGIPDADRPDVFHLTDVITRAADPRQGISGAEGAAAEKALFGYAQDLGAEKRRNPTDDVWSILTVAEVEDDDGTLTRLTPLELDQFFLILTIAGSETTRNVISGGLVALLEHPEQMARLQANPALLNAASEEMIRWVSPVVCFTRTATGDLDLGGQHIATGDRVSLWFPSANRDARAFDHPEEFDVARDPNPQVGFGGGGMHFCLGAHLARREIRVMFEHLLARFPEVEMTGPVSYVVGAPEQTVAVSLENVPVRLAPE